jgi:fibronectin type 3 domain-containing protein
MVVKRLLLAVLAIGCVAAMGFYFFVQHGARRSEPAKVHRVMLSWSKVARANSYNVYRRNYRGGEFALQGKTEATNFEDGAAMGQERFCYQIAAVDTKEREGPRSKEFCVTVPNP